MKYLDRAFFKFTLGFLCIISISLFLVLVASSLEEENPQLANPQFVQ